MKSVLFFFGAPGEARFALRVLQMVGQLAEVKISGLTASARAYAVLNGSLPISSVSETLRSFGPAATCAPEAIIREANQFLRDTDIKMVNHGDPLLSLFVKSEIALEYTARLTLAYRNMLLQVRPSAIMRYGGGDVPGRLLMIVAERLGISNYVLTTGPSWDRCGVVCSGLAEQWTWTSFPPRLRKDFGRPFGAKDRARLEAKAESYFARHEQRPRLNTYVENVASLKQGNSVELAEFRVTLEELAEDYLSLEQPWHALVLNGNLRWLDERRSFPYDPIPDQFFYMPLNQPWDSPHRTNNPMNFLQEHIAEIVNHSLPYGYRLAVKEHPYTFGHPSHTALRKLQKMGVCVIPPEHHSLDLVRRSAGVFSVGDTTGWEAVLLGVPSIVYDAAPFYVHCPGVMRADGPGRVHRHLRRAAELGSGIYESNARYALIEAAFASSYRGNIWGYKGLVWIDADRSSDNIADIATMIVREVLRPTIMGRVMRRFRRG